MDDGSFLVLDIGKKKKKALKRLRRGEGKLMEKVQAAVDEARASAPPDEAPPTVIVIARQKRKRRHHIW